MHYVLTWLRMRCENANGRHAEDHKMQDGGSMNVRIQDNNCSEGKHLEKLSNLKLAK
jgi:hypothetical protein